MQIASSVWHSDLFCLLLVIVFLHTHTHTHSLPVALVALPGSDYGIHNVQYENKKQNLKEREEEQIERVTSILLTQQIISTRNWRFCAPNKQIVKLIWSFGSWEIDGMLSNGVRLLCITHGHLTVVWPDELSISWSILMLTTLSTVDRQKSHAFPLKANANCNAHTCQENWAYIYSGLKIDLETFTRIKIVLFVQTWPMRMSLLLLYFWLWSPVVIFFYRFFLSFFSVLFVCSLCSMWTGLFGYNLFVHFGFVRIEIEWERANAFSRLCLHSWFRALMFAVCVCILAVFFFNISMLLVFW